MLNFTLTEPEELVDIAKKILTACNDSRIFTFTGNLGAGKTTLIQYLCRELGSEDSVTSPTFSLVNEYMYHHGLIYHMDLYRVKTIEEALDFGIEEYLFSGSYCFIEWPEVIADLLDMDQYAITIDVTGDGIRKIEVRKVT